jgi:6-phosphofructokinase 1
MVGIRHHEIIFNKFEEIMNQPKDIHKDDLRIAKILSI